MNKSLNKSIIFTLAYFGGTQYPLTLFELWRNLIQTNGKKEKFSFLEVKYALRSEELLDKVEQASGMFFLKGDKRLVEHRIRADKFSVSKLKRLKRWSVIFRWIPYVRGVFLTGTLSMKNAKNSSDWDVLMVLAKNRIWIGRLFLAIALQIIGKRRHGKNVKERFCLNHYITENALILEEHNEFCANFVTFSSPVLNGTLHKKFLQMNEFWIQGFKANYSKDEITENELTSFEPGGISKFVQEKIEWFLEKSLIADMINGIAKKVMIKKIKKNPKTKWKNADIRYNDTALIFLPKPHRLEMMGKTKERLTKMSS